MANRNGKKAKKPLQTSLGKATSPNEREVDLSHVQKPINTSVFGLRQVLSLFQTATNEVQNYITYECDIMYECRTCRTIFRSLANFILHKRNYCRERFSHLDSLNNNEELQEESLETAQNVIQEESTDKNDVANTKKSLLPVIERLKEKQEICQLAQVVLNQDLSSKNVEDDSNESEVTKKQADLLLEEIATNNAAVFQTVLHKIPKQNFKKSEFMKSEVMEIHGMLDSDEAVLGPDGKICTFNTNKINENPIIPKNNLICTECHVKFSTKKTLTYHIKYKHNNTRLVYVCPDCKDTFANAWCVYRHLYKIHRRTSAQIKRMREQIHNSCVRKDQEPVKRKDKKSPEKNDKADEENQWMSNIEGDNDFQMCGGCGKRFERKAALHSHAQMCTKRIAVCNTIKENNAKKKEEEVNKYIKSKTSKTGKVVLKGSSKRKPYLLRTYKYNEKESEVSEKGSSDKEGDDVCDVNANCEIVETNCDNNKEPVEDENAHEVNSSLSSLEELVSPSKKDFVSSPSIEKIDTEKMLNIIGITTDYSSNESRPNSNEDGISNSEQDLSTESNRSHIASDFDLFCQTVAETLLSDPLGSTSGEAEELPQKPSKTVPLILRRRNNSVKHEKRNATLEQNIKTLHIDLLNDNKVEDGKTSHEESKNIVETNSSIGVTSSSSKNFKISVKSLEDLIGVSPKNHNKNSENDECDDVQIRKNELAHVNFTDSQLNQLSHTLRANVSPEKLRDKYPKCIKRKRTSSFDFTEYSKFSKLSKGISFSNKQDVSFISRASPFMDQNKLLCIPCQTTYPTLSKLLWHMSAHFSWFRFQCSRCSFISFNKLDCANHARRTHHVRKSAIQSVVLPIPNWKTVLMSHDFCMLNDENDLSGKHTDEILSGNSVEAAIEDLGEKTNEDCDEPEWTNRLFVESKSADYEPENDPLEPDIPLTYANDIKQENIDVVNDDQESFQIEVPQEIYTLDVSEIIEGVNCEERYRYGARIKIEKINDEEDTNMSNFTSTDQENEVLIEEIKIKTEPISDGETTEKIFERNEVNNLEEPQNFNKQAEQIVNIRPTRNRIRSIKTIQDDFFYDLSKVIKLNDTSLSRSNLQKHKKSASQKNAKDSHSSNCKSDTQSIRVYAKKSK